MPHVYFCRDCAPVPVCGCVRVYLFLRRCMRGSFYSAYTCADIDIFLHSSAWFWLCLWTLIEVGNQPEVAFCEGHTLCPCINVSAFNVCLTLPVTIPMTVSVGVWAKELVAGMPSIAGKEFPVFWTPVYTR